MSRFDRDRSLTNVCTDTPGLASLRIEFLIEQSPSNSIVSYILFFIFPSFFPETLEYSFVYNCYSIKSIGIW